MRGMDDPLPKGPPQRTGNAGETAARGGKLQDREHPACSPRTGCRLVTQPGFSSIHGRMSNSRRLPGPDGWLGTFSPPRPRCRLGVLIGLERPWTSPSWPTTCLETAGSSARRRSGSPSVASRSAGGKRNGRSTVGSSSRCRTAVADGDGHRHCVDGGLAGPQAGRKAGPHDRRPRYGTPGALMGAL